MIEMMFVLLFIHLILLKNNVFVSSVVIEALHDYMTEPELAYYFQTADRSIIPDYEVVYLPLVLPVKEAISLFGDEDEEIEYNFSAFQRWVQIKVYLSTNLISVLFNNDNLLCIGPSS